MEIGDREQRSGLGVLKEDLRKIMDIFLPEELRHRPSIRVLSVGCGWAPEATALSEFSNIYFEGIDTDDKALLGARSLNGNIPAERFREANALNPASFGDEPWDLIILRNPQIGGSIWWQGYAAMDREWKIIIENCIENLSPKGYIYVGSVNGDEAERVRDFLRRFNFIEAIPLVPLNWLDLKSNHPFREEYAALLQKP